MSEAISLEIIEQRICYQFTDKALLAQALVHASIAANRVASNERLEFLGDAILGTVVCEHLYRRFPGELEGELTKIKSNAVSRRVCAEIAVDLGLADAWAEVGSYTENTASTISYTLTPGTPPKNFLRLQVLEN